jgi:hypothetical protein
MLHYLTDPGASAASAVALQKGVRIVGMSARICNRKRDTLALHGTWTYTRSSRHLDAEHAQRRRDDDEVEDAPAVCMIRCERRKGGREGGRGAEREVSESVVDFVVVHRYRHQYTGRLSACIQFRVGIRVGIRDGIRVVPLKKGQKAWAAKLKKSSAVVKMCVSEKHIERQKQHFIHPAAP